MFDMTKTGKRISQLRKEKNITQMELADKLGISFQAVSNWERGNTMPDISKLPELARILGVTVDDLLGSREGARIIESANNNQAIPQDADVEAVAEVAPLLKPSQITSYVEGYREKRKESHTKQNFCYDMEWLITMAPFLDEEILAEIANEIFESEGTVQQLVALAPFMDEEDVAALAAKVLARGGRLEELVALARFMEEEEIGKIVIAAIQRGAKISAVVGLAPLMDEDDVQRAAQLYIQNGGNPKELVVLMPFMQDLSELFRKGFGR